MITLSHEQLEKINLLDKLFGAMSVDQLKEFTESEQIVAKLKGTQDNPQILLNIIHEYDTMKIDLMTAKSDITVLKTDFQSLIRILHTDVFSPRYNNDFNNLKNKHGVY